MNIASKASQISCLFISKLKETVVGIPLRKFGFNSKVGNAHPTLYRRLLHFAVLCVLCVRDRILYILQALHLLLLY